MLNPLSAKKSKVVQSESDFMPACASLSGLAVPYHFSISIIGGFAFGHVVYIQHPALKGLK